jgi:hypothetical protein
MLKRFSIVLLIITALLCFSVPAFAAGDTSIITITKPEGNDTTYKKSYVICGYTDFEDVKVTLSIKKDDEYVPLYNTDGKDSWIIGSSGVFMKEVILNKGANEIKITASRDGDVIPENYFYTITVLEKVIEFKNGLDSVAVFLKSIFENK